MTKVDAALTWATLTELARIHQIPRKRRVKGGAWQQRSKEDVAKDIRRAMAGTFPDRMQRSRDVLNRLKP